MADVLSPSSRCCGGDCIQRNSDRSVSRHCCLNSCSAVPDVLPVIAPLTPAIKDECGQHCASGIWGEKQDGTQDPEEVLKWVC